MPPSFGQPTVASIIKQLEANNGTEKLDLTNNATFQMRPAESMAQLAKALQSNTVVKVLVLKHCKLNDAAASELGELLAQNQILEELDLENNNISSPGAIAIAAGLVKNRGVRLLNMLNQQSNGAFGEGCLEKYMDMLGHNITLTKILWRLESRKSFALNKMITRNVEIWRRVSCGRGDYVDILPDHMRESPPAVLTEKCAPKSNLESAPEAAARPAAAPEAAAEATVAPEVAKAEAPEAEAEEPAVN